MKPKELEPELRRLMRTSLTALNFYSPRTEEIWKIFCKAGLKDEYKRIHAEVKKEVIDEMLGKAGVSQYEAESGR